MTLLLNLTLHTGILSKITGGESMDSILVSVVIPIYKVEKYLNRCIENVVNQTYRNLEIILVDDESPDNCPKLCDEWATKDTRIKVIHKKNGGLGFARNSGIEIANGDYICFFDSDDYVDLKTIELCVESAITYKSDIVKFGVSEIDEHNNCYNKTPCLPKEVFCNEEVVDVILKNMLEADSKEGRKANLSMSAWSAMYSMNIIKQYGWRFVSEREYISEDYYSLLDLYKYIKVVSIVNRPLYFYCFNTNSLTHVFDENRYARIKACYIGMKELSKFYEDSKRFEPWLASQFLGSVIGCLKLVASSSDPVKYRKFKRIAKDPFLLNEIKKIDVAAQPFGRKIFVISLRLNCVLLAYLLVRIKA